MGELNSENLERLRSLMIAFYEERADENLTEIFTLFDTNKNGSIEASELKAVMSQVSGEKVPDEDISGMIEEADTNKNGIIELNEFIQIMKNYRDT